MVSGLAAEPFLSRQCLMKTLTWTFWVPFTLHRHTHAWRWLDVVLCERSEVAEEGCVVNFTGLGNCGLTWNTDHLTQTCHDAATLSFDPSPIPCLLSTYFRPVNQSTCRSKHNVCGEKGSGIVSREVTLVP